VLPVYNQAQYLPAALDGILAQTFTDYELIVVNDGSSDATPQVLDAYQSRLPFRRIDQQNRGLPHALNAGFAQARGSYLTWTSSDNIMHAEMLKVLLRELERDPAVGVAYADWIFIDDEGRDLAPFRTLDYDRILLLYFNIVHCCFLYRQACMDRVGLYDPESIYGEDWEYWIRISRYFGMRHVPQFLYSYRLHPRTMTSDIVAGRVKRTGYDVFSRRLKREMPLAWYYARLKWRIVSRRVGRDVRKEWLQIVETTGR
jgi:glycosyltransferase involved in cell wall biosynthesis